MDNKFPKRMNIKTFKTQYGEIIKLGIHKDVFKDNDVTGDWLNIDILRSKKDNSPYLVINEWKPTKNESEEEIPY